MSDLIESALREMGSTIEFPETPRFATPAEPVSARRRVWPAVALAAAALILVFAFPGPRQAVADLFGVGAVRIQVVDELPQVELLRRLPGVGVSMEQARESVDFEILELPITPDDVFVEEMVPGGMVTLAYGVAESSYRLTVTQLESALDFGAVTKLLLNPALATPVTVDGEDGFWIEGDHVLLLIDSTDAPIEDAARLAGSTLLYEDGVRTIRIEGEMSLTQALDIAAALR